VWFREQASDQGKILTINQSATTPYRASLKIEDGVAFGPSEQS
jgi:hypothetical protein